MKTKIYLGVISLCSICTMKGQVVLYEGFTTPFNPSTSGWNVQNLSAPVGSNSWSQGSNAFNALIGGATDYYAVDFNSTAGTGPNNTISNWLITPTLNLVNGAVVQFATRTSSPLTGFADRLQLYYSTAGNSTNVGTTAGTATNTAGTFTNILLDINSTQLAMGYPDYWFVNTITLSGVTTPTVGRLAFRYYITNAGAGGINGNFIGIDEFRYSMPCSQALGVAMWNGALCSGNPVDLSIMVTAGSINSYTWITGANTSTTSFVPPVSGMNAIYVLWETTSGCVNLEVANINVLPSPSVSVNFIPNGNICSGDNVTLTASGANSYTYAFSLVNSSTLNPVSFTVPAVTALTTTSVVLSGSGTANSCVHTQTLQLTVNPNPTVSATLPTAQPCIGETAQLGAIGASTYTWSGAGNSTSNPYNYLVAAPAGLKSFTLIGTSIEGCESAPAVVTVTVSNCTGIENVSNSLNTIAFYPNPFREQLYVKGFTGKVKIYNDLGQLMKSAELHEREAIDTRNLSAGVYIVKLINNSGVQQTVRLIKD